MIVVIVAVDHVLLVRKLVVKMVVLAVVLVLRLSARAVAPLETAN